MRSFYKQDEENPDWIIVCPECGSEILVSEFGELAFCEKCGEEHPIDDCPCHDAWVELNKVDQEFQLSKGGAEK